MRYLDCGLARPYNRDMNNTRIEASVARTMLADLGIRDVPATYSGYQVKVEIDGVARSYALPEGIRGLQEGKLEIRSTYAVFVPRR